MKNIDDINKIMKAVELEMKLKETKKEADAVMMMNDVYMIHIDKKYEGKLRDIELIKEVQRRMTELTKIITSFKDIEHQAIVIKDMDIYWKCEAKIAKMINQMEIMRNKYGC